MRSLSLVVAGLGTAAAIAFFVVGGRSGAPPPGERPSLELQSAAAELDGTLRELAAGIHARATTLAELPRLGVAVATDAATVRDLTSEELAFRPQPHETVEIGQVWKDGRVERLYRSDGNAPPLPLEHAGTRLLRRGDELFFVDVLDVAPRERKDELRGALAIAQPVPMAKVTARLASAHVPAELRVDGARIPLAGGAIADGARTVEVAVPGDLADGASLFAAITAPASGPVGRRGLVQGLAIALALLSWAVAFVLGRAPRQREDAPAASAIAAATTGVGGATSANAGGASMPGMAARPSTDGHAATEIGAIAAVGGAPPGVAGRGSRIGRYDLIRTLGSGGMADVYLARATGEAGFEKLIALKVLQRHMAQNEMVVEHFLDEARLASRLTHPNIVQITDLGRAGDEYFIAMEYVEGSDLERLLAASRALGEAVPLRIAFAIVRRACDGLHAAHVAVTAEGKPLELVHRDVKAANIFVARNGAVKIGDFGIAKANQDSKIVKTIIGQVKGTAAYMAPEHRQGFVVDRRADVYALGAVAYEVFTGTEVNLDVAIIGPLGRLGWPHLPLPSSVRPDLPPELDAVLWKALAFDKADRFDGCEALEEALDEIATKYGYAASDKAVAQWVAHILSEGGAAQPGTASSGGVGLA